MYLITIVDDNGDMVLSHSVPHLTEEQIVAIEAVANEGQES